APNEFNDWVEQRDEAFSKYIIIGKKRYKTETVLFDIFSSGLKTQRDTWAYNYSQKGLGENIERAVEYFNDQSEKVSITKNERGLSYTQAEKLISTDPTKFK